VANGKYNVVWHEQLAKLAGMIDPAGPSLGGGNKQNYAFAGAVADDTNQTTKVKSTVLGDVVVDNVVKQVNDFLALKNVPAKALYPRLFKLGRFLARVTLVVAGLDKVLRPWGAASPSPILCGAGVGSGVGGGRRVDVYPGEVGTRGLITA